MKPISLKYAMARVDGIYSDRAKEINDRYNKLQKTLTDEERLKLLRAGKVKLKKSVERIDRYANVVSVFDFSEFEGLTKTQKDALMKELEPLRMAVHRLRDELALGDEAKALELLRAFEAGND